jgi:protein phosphatase
MGDRRTQEDRYVIVPDLELDGSDGAFFGVFDGTVGDFASDTVKDIIVGETKRYLRQLDGRTPRDELESVMQDTYRSADSRLLDECSKHQQHYATSTSVTLLLRDDDVVVNHLGDSRVALRIADASGVQDVFVTRDHKPDQDHERQRIEECGGMVERLVNHNNKPFIRGGDFMMRKALGEQPMQLQYSRAFGAKDLKMFGLSSFPDTSFFDVRNVEMAILASDGLWDVLSAAQAMACADKAIQENVNPSDYLVRSALMLLKEKGARADNITVLVVQFKK